MKVNTRVTYEHTVEIDDLVFPTAWHACEYVDAKYTIDGDVITLAYAVLDEDAREPIEDDFGVEWKEFRTEWDRDEFAESKIAEGKHVFVVDHFEHSGSLYRVLGTFEQARNMRGIDQWDSRPSVIVALDPDFTDPLGAAQSIVETYTAWAGGDCYGVATETYERIDGELVQRTEEACWGYYGVTQANEAIAEALA